MKQDSEKQTNRFDNFKYTVQDKKKLRVIVDTDAACEADAPFAIVHALLTPRFHVKGIIAEQFTSEGSEASVDKSYAVIEKLLKLMNITDMPMLRGSYAKLENEQDIRESEGTDFIIEEARRESDQPLYVLCMGALTNVAIALNRHRTLRTNLFVSGLAGRAGRWEIPQVWHWL